MPLRLPRTRRARLITAGVAAAVLVGGLAVGAQAATAAASDRLDAALASAATTVGDARERYDTLVAEQAAATERLEATATTVLDQGVRDTLAAALDETVQRSIAARAEVESAETVLEQGEAVDASLLELGGPQREAADAVEALEFDDLARFDESVTALGEPVAQLAAAVAAWDERQALLASASYANHVWAAGWYPELDACKGSVDLTERYDQVPTIAEHWSCGGREFPDEAGTVIRLTGVHEGVYRVEGIVKMLNQATATSNDLPRGYDLLYQTCQNGQSSSMSITALTRLG
ncbi:hypothetical protein [Agromyces arachidis]|uniref:hypothetical protein n=1 Tax=Agromyces arachidis TaxID=766966 RepID=UPI004056090C